MAAVYAFDYSDGSTAVVGSSGAAGAAAGASGNVCAELVAGIHIGSSVSTAAMCDASAGLSVPVEELFSLSVHVVDINGLDVTSAAYPYCATLAQHSRAATVARCDPLFVNVDAGGAASRPAADQQRPARCVRCRLVLAFASQSWFADSIRQIQAIQRREWDGYPFRQLPCFIDKVHGEVDLVQAGAILRHLARSTTCTAVTLGTAARVDMMLDAVAELRGKLRDVVVVQRLGEGGRCWRRSSSSRRTT
ncbi:hypothetical protein HXX76_007188 [Chlamydomonas incerta]|uniref:Uncharacterized protein n=1 Tax=Chlamydomonas incerta TaxID=51695 RepID=A0A835W2R0_CHLIN|nr:hypothetical protein HXX76_007188 [Chlamydomonas incerta]|eukprot:KAG2435103.1 hypothetical protein HXX76_007188 [Chlamydomonas incerta]